MQLEPDDTDAPLATTQIFFWKRTSIKDGVFQVERA
jgi:hypothetical protein